MMNFKVTFIRTINFLLYEYLIQYVNGVMCLITSIPFVNFECLIFDTFTFCVQHNNKKEVSEMMFEFIICIHGHFSVLCMQALYNYR